MSERHVFQMYIIHVFKCKLYPLCITYLINKKWKHLLIFLYKFSTDLSDDLKSKLKYFTPDSKMAQNILLLFHKFYVPQEMYVPVLY